MALETFKVGGKVTFPVVGGQNTMAFQTFEYQRGYFSMVKKGGS